MHSKLLMTLDDFSVEGATVLCSKLNCSGAEINGREELGKDVHTPGYEIVVVYFAFADLQKSSHKIKTIRDGTSL